jgi:type IV pilus assembly protein PilM
MARAPRQKAKKLGRGKRFSTGVDIGTYSVKIVTLAGDDAGGLDINKITVVPLSPAELHESQETRLERQRAGLKEAYKKHGKFLGKVTLGYPRRLATTRYINFPSANREEIREMLLFDVERHVPFAVDDLVVSYQKIEQVGEHETRLLMVCTPKKEIIPYVEMCFDVGITVDALDLDVFGDCTAYKQTTRPEDALAIVNFGQTSVNFAVILDGTMIFSRNLPVSELQLIRHFPGCHSWNELRGRITAVGPVNPNEKKHYDAWIDRLGTEMKRCISAFECEHAGQKLDRLIFCGGAGYFPAGPPRGLSKYISLQPMVDSPLNGEIPAHSDYHGSELATVVGLAIRGLSHSQDNLNLLPEVYIDEQRHQQKVGFRKNVAILLFMILILLGGTGFLKWNLNYTQNQKLDALAQERKAESVAIQAIMKDIKVVEEYLDSKNSCTNILKDVLQVFRKQKCYVSKITFTKQRTLEITGQVLSEEAFQMINSELNNFIDDGSTNSSENKYFTAVFPRDTGADELVLNTNRKLPVYKFTIICSLKSNEVDSRRR